MEKIEISIEEYRRLLKIRFCSETYLEIKLPSTEKRLREYLNEFNNIENI